MQKMLAVVPALFVLISPAAKALSIDEARHLLTRTGFGASPQEIARLLPDTRQQAVDGLLSGLDPTPLVQPPAFLKQGHGDYLQRIGDYAPTSMTGVKEGTLDKAGSEVLTKIGMQEMEQLRVWWLDQMVSTKSPMTERIALFWHNHFTSQYFDVLEPKLMFDQLQTIRSLGIRNYGVLLKAIMHDPAMLIYLDNALNTRTTINENFARETLELFTLGIGNYTQADVRALAHIYAGNSVDFGGDWKYISRPADHDNSAKVFLGQTGNFGVDDAASILLADPQTAVFLTAKFYREFISPEADPVEISRLAAVLRTNNYEMRPFLRALFLAPAFWAQSSRAQLIKSPVDFIVGFSRTFGVPIPDAGILNNYTYVLRQQLFQPPSVQGWKGGMNWLTAESVSTRTAMIRNLWSARAGGLRYYAAGSGDLILRYSSVAASSRPVPFAVAVNGHETYRGNAEEPTSGKAEGPQVNAMWQILDIRRADLPARVRTVDVIFNSPHDQFFINWLQVGGQRFSVADTTTTYTDPNQPCGTGVPKGMVYCAARVRFTLTGAHAVEGQAAETLRDRRAPYNSVVEYATARQALAMRPAGRNPLTLPVSFADDWRVLPAFAAGGTMPLDAILPSAPFLPQRVALKDTGAMIKAATYDPAFNLK